MEHSQGCNGIPAMSAKEPVSVHSAIYINWQSPILGAQAILPIIKFIIVDWHKSLRSRGLQRCTPQVLHWILIGMETPGFEKPVHSLLHPHTKVSFISILFIGVRSVLRVHSINPHIIHIVRHARRTQSRIDAVLVDVQEDIPLNALE